MSVFLQLHFCQLLRLLASFNLNPYFRKYSADMPLTMAGVVDTKGIGESIKLSCRGPRIHERWLK